MGYEIDYAEGGETFIREEPDCGTCGDAGEVIVFEFTDGQHTENCPDCNPTEEQVAARDAQLVVASALVCTDPRHRLGEPFCDACAPF